MKDHDKFKSMLEKFQTTEYTNDQLRKICNALLHTLISSQRAHEETFELLMKYDKKRLKLTTILTLLVLFLLSLTNSLKDIDFMIAYMITFSFLNIIISD